MPWEKNKKTENYISGFQTPNEKWDEWLGLKPIQNVKIKKFQIHENYGR